MRTTDEERHSRGSGGLGVLGVQVEILSGGRTTVWAFAAGTEPVDIGEDGGLRDGTPITAVF